MRRGYFELIICGILECVKSRRDLRHLLFVSVVKRFSLIVLIAHCLFFIGSAFRKKRKNCHVSYNTLSRWYVSQLTEVGSLTRDELFFRQDLSEQLDDEEESSAEMAEARKKMEAEINDLKQDIDDLETALKKVGLGIDYKKTIWNARITASLFTPCFYQERNLLCIHL